MHAGCPRPGGPSASLLLRRSPPTPDPKFVNMGDRLDEVHRAGAGNEQSVGVPGLKVSYSIALLNKKRDFLLRAVSYKELHTQ